MESTSAYLKYMIDNQHRATRLILEEQNEMFCHKSSSNDQTDISEFFDSQLDANSEVMRYLYEVRDCLIQAIETPLELPSILNSLREDACKGNNEWILDTFSEVIEYMEQPRYSTAIEHSGVVEPTRENVRRAA